MGRVFFVGGKRDMDVPVGGIVLSALAEGSIVKLNESGSPVEFYIAKHNYESGLNGADRTLLVRKDSHSNQVWDADSVNAYSGSDIDTWFNGTYKALHDANVQSAMGTTKFYYTPGNGNTSVTTLVRAVFALSMAELNVPSSVANTEGSSLPIASTLQRANLNGVASPQWTRTPYINATTHSCCVTQNGASSGQRAWGEAGGRPAFTLPSNAMFDEITMLFKGVA
jgi:hypothetical protein